MWDFGVDAPSGLAAGRFLTTCCLANLGEVDIVPSASSLWMGAAVQVWTDQPVAACMASQYAGWRISRDGYFGMGSGPMRVVARKEPLFEKLPYTETADRIVGIIESSQIPPDSVVRYLAESCNVATENVMLLVASTSSLAGTVQIVARSVETALHKMFELGFDLNRVASGSGVAPLPPVANDDLNAIGRTNDAILYGAEVTLWVRGDDQSLQEIIHAIPSNASRDFGRPFREIFHSYDRDFYRIDPHLFSPASIRLCNMDSGQSCTAGELRPDLIAASFLG
jgi:methenyltetrahydromethanopterin cyclohydrolase